MRQRAESAAPSRTTGVENPRVFQTLLLVEDDASVRKTIRRCLELLGFKVVDAEDGWEAICVSQHYAGPIHLLVTDVMMPQMDGRELADRLTLLRPDLKVLFLSGYPADGLPDGTSLDAEAAFLQKPFTAAALAHKVCDVLQGGERCAAPDQPLLLSVGADRGQS